MRRRQFETNSIGSALRLPTITLLLLACVLLFGTSSALAVPMFGDPMEIQFTGVNLLYAGNTISDFPDPNGGNGDPNKADPLDSIQFKVGGVLLGSVTSDIFLDVSIPDVTGLTDMDMSTVVTTPGNAGYFDLLIDTDPNEPQFLRLETDEVTITYLNITDTVQFVFGAAIVAIDEQNLPFGLEIGNLVTVSFSTRVDEGTKTNDDPNDPDLVTGFTAWGTGQVIGVPEPSSCVLGAIALAASCACRRRWW